VHRQGIVVEATTGEPVAGVEITVGVAAPTGNSITAQTMTDSAGRFQIDSPAPRYLSQETFQFSKAGYLPQGSHWGTQLQDASGDIHRIQMVLRMSALSTIQGMVVDAHGKPFLSPVVQLIPEDRHGNITPNVNERGEFQAQVLPGVYRLCAVPYLPQSGKHVRFTSAKACYPSAENVDDATPVTVDPGKTTPSLEIRLREMPVFAIRGRVTRVPSGWGVHVMLDKVEGGATGHALYFGCIERNGSFVIWGVPTGIYSLHATTGKKVGSSVCDKDRRPLLAPARFDDYCGFPAPPPAVVYTGERSLTVKGDLKGILVTVKRN
jgi:hypothetical protein